MPLSPPPVLGPPQMFFSFSRCWCACRSCKCITSSSPASSTAAHATPMMKYTNMSLCFSELPPAAAASEGEPRTASIIGMAVARMTLSAGEVRYRTRSG